MYSLKEASEQMDVRVAPCAYNTERVDIQGARVAQTTKNVENKFDALLVCSLRVAVRAGRSIKCWCYQDQRKRGKSTVPSIKTLQSLVV